MKLDEFDRVPLRVLRDVLRARVRASERISVPIDASIEIIAEAIDWALEASSAATRSSDGQDAERSPSSSVPEMLGESTATCNRCHGYGFLLDMPKGGIKIPCPGCQPPVPWDKSIAAKALLWPACGHMATQSGTSTSCPVCPEIAAAREAGRRERDAEVAALLESHAGAIADWRAWQKEICDALPTMPGGRIMEAIQVLRADLARVTAERDKEKKRMSELVNLLQDIGKALIDAERACLGDALEALPAAVSLLTRAYGEARSALAEAQAEVERLQGNLDATLTLINNSRAAGRREGILAAHKIADDQYCDAAADDNYGGRKVAGQIRAALRSLLSDPWARPAGKGREKADEPEVICPRCDSWNVAISGGQPIACHACGWEGNRKPAASPAKEERVGILAAAKILEGFASGRWVANGQKARRLLRRAAADLRAIASTPPQAPETPVTPNSQATETRAKCDNLSQVGASEAGDDSLVARLRALDATYEQGSIPGELRDALTEAADALEGAESEVARRIAEAVAETFDWCATNVEVTMRRFNGLSEGWRALEIVRHAIRARAKKGG